MEGFGFLMFGNEFKLVKERRNNIIATEK